MECGSERTVCATLSTTRFFVRGTLHRGKNVLDEKVLWRCEKYTLKEKQIVTNLFGLANYILQPGQPRQLSVT